MTTEEIDAHNIEVFARRGTDDEDEPRHRCVLCGKPVSIAESRSDRGKNLICWTCYHRKFSHPLDAIRWINGGRK